MHPKPAENSSADSPEPTAVDVAQDGDELLAGFDTARRSQKAETSAYRVISPFADEDDS